jgi:hypothetical protein
VDAKSLNDIEALVFQNGILEILMLWLEVILAEYINTENIVLWLSDAEIVYVNVNFSIMTALGILKQCFPQFPVAVDIRFKTKEICLLDI